MNVYMKTKQLIMSKLVFILTLFCLVYGSTVLSAKTVRVGYFNKKPIAFRDKTGQASGLAVDILKDVAKQNRWELSFEYGSFPSVLRKLVTGKIDLMAPVGYTKERDKKIDYTSVPFFES